MPAEMMAGGVPSEEVSRVALEICFRLAAIENLVLNVLVEFTKISSSDTYDRQMSENLRGVVECLLQMRGGINHKYRNTATWLAAVAATEQTATAAAAATEQTATAAARFESRMYGVHGQQLLDSFDLNDALSHATDTVTAFGEIYGVGESKDNVMTDAASALLQDDEFKLKNELGGVGSNNGFMKDIDEEIKIECNDDVDEQKWDSVMGDQFLLNVKEEDYTDSPAAPRKKRRSKFEGPGRFKCVKCDATFHEEEYLRQHENLFVHDKYRCELCEQTFSWKKTFDEHMRGHSDADALPPLSAAAKAAVENGSGVDTSATFKQEVSDQDVVKKEQGATSEDLTALNSTLSSTAAADNKNGGGRENEDEDDGGEDGYDDDEDYDPGRDLQEEDDVEEDERSNTNDADDIEAAISAREECDVCGKMVKDLSMHRRVHSGQKPYSCNICGKSFLRRSNMRKHKVIHGEREKNYCQTCGVGFLCQVSLNKHVMREEGCDKSQYVKLPKKPARPRHLDGTGKKHRVKPQEPKVKKKYFQKNPIMECDICGKVMKRSNLYSHRRTHTGEKPFKCEMCEKGFNSKFNLKLHITTHHTVREKMLCQNCGVGFLSKYSLLKHVCGKLKQKKETKDISCPICGKQVKAEGGLKCHMKIHSDERPHTCEICGDSFRRPYEINIHKMRAHDNPKCEICATSFTSISALNRHQLHVHSDKRPFACDVCGKAYKEKRSLLKHKVIHNKDEHVKCKCEVCPKSFFFLSDLRKHYQKVHKLDINMQ